MEWILKKIPLKKNAPAVLQKAFTRGLISKAEIRSMLQAHLWLEDGQKKLTLYTLTLEGFFRKRGIIISGEEEKKQHSQFSISDFPIFSPLTDAEKKEIASLFVKNKKEYGETILGLEQEDNHIFFLAYGAATINLVNEEGDERILQFMGENDIFLIPEDFYATVRSEQCFFWRLPNKKLNNLPPLLKSYILCHLKSQEENLWRLKISSIKNSTERIEEFCRFLDDKYPLHFRLTDQIIGDSALFTRETVTRRKRLKE